MRKKPELEGGRRVGEPPAAEREIPGGARDIDTDAAQVARPAQRRLPSRGNEAP